MTVPALTALFLMPAAAAVASTAAVAAVFAQAPTSWPDLLERFGVGVLAAVAAVWVCIWLGKSVLQRLWKREDLADEDRKQRELKWQSMAEKTLLSLQASTDVMHRIDKRLEEVAEKMGACGLSQKQWFGHRDS
jgi:hypothetical protein